jgi:hypothetical protein
MMAEEGPGWQLLPPQWSEVMRGFGWVLVLCKQLPFKAKANPTLQT